MKQIKIRIDFLDVDITVIPCKINEIVMERNKLRKKYPNLPPYKSEHEPGALHTSDYGLYPYRHWLFFEQRTTVGAVNHEIQHCVDEISDYHGIHDTEFRAYLFEYITSKIIGFREVVFK